MKETAHGAPNASPRESTGIRFSLGRSALSGTPLRLFAALVVTCLASARSIPAGETCALLTAVPFGEEGGSHLSEVHARADSVAALDALLLVASREGDLSALLDHSREKRRQSAALAARLLLLLEGQEQELVSEGALLAPFLLEQERSEHTLRALLPFIETVPDSVGDRGFLCLTAGVMLRHEGKNAQASRYFEAAARAQFPLATHSLYLATETAVGSREPERMLELLGRMEASQQPGYLLDRARLLVGLALVESPPESEALRILEAIPQAGMSRAEKARVAYALGTVYERAEEYRKAAGSYARAFEKATAAREAVEASAAYLGLIREGRIAEDESELLSAARCLVRQGRGLEARAILKELFREGRGSLEAGWELGRLFYRTRRYSDAAAVYATLKKLETRAADSRRADLWVARCERQLYHTEEAIRLFRQISVSGRHVVSIEAGWELGMELESLGRLEEAAQSYDSLYRRFPESSLGREGLWRRGLCEYRRGLLDRARATFASVASERVASSLHDSATFWMLKCSFESEKPPSREELQRLKPKGDSLYGLLLKNVSKSGALSEKLFRTPVSVDNPLLDGDRAGREEATVRQPAEGGGRERSKEESHERDESVRPGPEFSQGLPPEVTTAAELLRFGLRELAREELRVAENSVRGAEALFYLAQLYWRSGFYKESLSLADRLLKNKRGLGETERRFLERMLYPIYGIEIVLEESRAQGIDPFLVLSVMRRESTFDPEATSAAGATGVMQLMPGTAGEIAAYLGEDDPSDRLADPELNIRYGVWLLGKLKGKYSDSVAAALAAYNAGEYNAERWSERVGFEDEFLYMESISFRETREYLRRVLNDLHVYRSLYVR